MHGLERCPCTLSTKRQPDERGGLAHYLASYLGATSTHTPKGSPNDIVSVRKPCPFHKLVACPVTSLCLFVEGIRVELLARTRLTHLHHGHGGDAWHAMIVGVARLDVPVMLALR